MFSGLWESTWFDKIALPLIVGLITTFVYTHSGSILAKFWARQAKRRARELIASATTYIGSETHSGASVYILMMMGHLLVRTAALIVSSACTFVTYAIMVLGKDDKLSLMVVIMSMITGIFMIMVRNVLDSISTASIASSGPGTYIARLEKNWPRANSRVS